MEVRFENLTIEANVYVGSRGLPSLLNAYRGFFEVSIMHNLWHFPCNPEGNEIVSLPYQLPVLA